MKTLIWVDGVAQGLEGRTCAKIVGAQHVYEAITIQGDRWIEIRRNGTFATRDAAERACEAALWRLGILKLPEWVRTGTLWESRKVGTVNAERRCANHLDCYIELGNDGTAGYRTVGCAAIDLDLMQVALIADAVENGGDK